MIHIRAQSGFSILEVLIGMAILTIISTSIYFAYSNVIEIVQTAQYNNAALSIMESRIETARNMRYEDVGVIAGVPAGKLQQTEVVMLGSIPFTLHTYVRNIDDPFDGTLGGVPNDTAPADYKLVEYQITCDTCTRYKLLTMATYVAPKNLETTSKNGNLFVQVLNAFGIPVSGATVHVTNSSVSPSIDLTDITNSDGQLQLVDIATSSAGYHMTVSKAGYSNDQTYPPGSPANPLKPDATVATQQLTISTLAIDRLSTLTLKARDSFCAPASFMDLLLTGTKLIGTAPDVPKYSVAHSTNESGTLSLTNVEWDTYALKPTDTIWDIAGVIATSSLNLTIDPNTTHSILWQTAPRSANGLLISVADSFGNLLNDATVRVTGPGDYDRTVVTGRTAIAQTDWSGGAYDSQSGGIDAGTELTLSAAALLASASTEWIISDTYDLGSSSTTFQDISWTPTSDPPTTEVTFQLAGNNDDMTWNFIGPDSTAGSFFTSPGQTVPSALNGKRYLRYKAYLSHTIPLVGPSVNDVTVAFTSGCVIPGQAYFNELGSGTHTVTVTRTGYQTSVSTVNISDTWQRAVIQLNP